jgi:hypothetical protein
MNSTAWRDVIIRCSPWRPCPALAALRLPSRTVAARPTRVAQVPEMVGILAAKVATV